jgi:copper chaperone
MHQVLNVQGMTCGHCERAVTEAVKTVDPQATVKIDLASGIVEIDSAQPREALANAITEEGYTVQAEKVAADAKGGGCGGKCSCG